MASVIEPGSLVSVRRDHENLKCGGERELETRRALETRYSIHTVSVYIDIRSRFEGIDPHRELGLVGL